MASSEERLLLMWDWCLEETQFLSQVILAALFSAFAHVGYVMHASVVRVAICNSVCITHAAQVPGLSYVLLYRWSMLGSWRRTIKEWSPKIQQTESFSKKPAGMQHWLYCFGCSILKCIALLGCMTCPEPVLFSGKSSFSRFLCLNTLLNPFACAGRIVAFKISSSSVGFSKTRCQARLDWQSLGLRRTMLTIPALPLTPRRLTHCLKPLSAVHSPLSILSELDGIWPAPPCCDVYNYNHTGIYTHRIYRTDDNAGLNDKWGRDLPE